ncbi:Beta-glucuronidase [Operophtera brumata]|uniref:Beta-glucuronidase n=1 Tax=Operophtera brumata TaxID=104452 RepID=A0A0L7LET1_OPEBR|nr:Beta-glucuronidase [Operophtera brumata]
MPVPSSYNDIVEDAATRDHVGVVWYDRRFFVPSGWACEKRVWLRFSSVHYAAEYVNGKSATFHEIGHLPFEVEITDLTDTLVTALQDCAGLLEIGNANLWWPYLMHPAPGYLYTFKTSLIDQNGEVIDTYSQKIGIRTVTWSNTTVYINEKPVYMRGKVVNHVKSMDLSRPVTIAISQSVYGDKVYPEYVWSEEYQLATLSEHFKAFDRLRRAGFFFGEMIWNFADFKTAQSK